LASLGASPVWYKWPHWSADRVSASVKRAQLFVTCLVDQFSPQVGLATAAILERLGVTVEVPDGLTCCGQPAFNGGFRDQARRMARHTVDVLTRSDAPVVVPSGSCADMIVHRYPDLLADDEAYAQRARGLAARTYELSQFLVDVLGVTDLGARADLRVAYHPSCHTLRGLGVDNQPRALLRNIRGLDCRELPHEGTCCGFGGLFAVKMGDISGAMLQQKLSAIEESGAGVVVGADLSCLMHIAGGLRRRGSTVVVRHLAEILAEADGT
jgi:L-lactate dehydrogenase complex protein LldE